jgi:hypothetical protein
MQTLQEGDAPELLALKAAKSAAARLLTAGRWDEAAREKQRQVVRGVNERRRQARQAAAAAAAAAAGATAEPSSG